MTTAALLTLIACSFLAIRYGSIALERTSLSRDAAHFQALSAFFGAGFTTSESELVVNHPVRRRVIRHLIILGNVGLTTFVATIVVSIATRDSDAARLRTLAWLGLGFTALWALSKSRVALRLIDFTIERTITAAPTVRAMDYEQLLHLRDGYAIAEVTTEPEHPLTGQTLAEVRLNDARINVLGVTRETGEHIAAPDGTVRLLPGDTLLVYGPEQAIQRLPTEDPRRPTTDME